MIVLRKCCVNVSTLIFPRLVQAGAAHPWDDCRFLLFPCPGVHAAQVDADMAPVSRVEGRAQEADVENVQGRSIFIKPDFTGN